MSKGQKKKKKKAIHPFNNACFLYMYSKIKIGEKIDRRDGLQDKNILRERFSRKKHVLLDNTNYQKPNCIIGSATKMC